VLAYEQDLFLYHLVMLGVLVLAIGLILRFIYPGFVIFGGERFSGLFGNPNAIGIYGFMFMALFTIIKYYQPHLFTNKQAIFVYAIIIISLILGGSRGGIFSAALFILAWTLLKRDPILGFIIMSIIFISYQLVMDNFIEIATSIGLEKYFRLETLETGSGRVLAREVAWENIQENYWFSKGFSYNIHVFSKYREYFEQMGHQGNIHNSWLTIWLDTGLIGLILFCVGWLVNFVRAARFTPLVWAVFFGILLSASVESWMVASLNPFTIQLVIILTLLSDERFYEMPEEEDDEDEEESNVDDQELAE
jgi:O-antigen ligase